MEDLSTFLSFCKIFTLFHLCLPVHPIPSPLIYIDAIDKEQNKTSCWRDFHLKGVAESQSGDNFHMRYSSIRIYSGIFICLFHDRFCLSFYLKGAAESQPGTISIYGDGG